MLVNGCEVAVVRDAGGCRQAAEVRARGAGRGRIPRRLRAVPAGRPPVRQSTGGGRRAQGAMFHCIVQPRNVWGPPDSPNAFPDIRMQLAEQTRVLEARAEATAGVAGELHDYCRRRAELEHEYARALDKLARAAAARHKDARHKRDAWALLGATAGWTAALDGARALARDHAALAELYGGALSARLARAAEDALRLHRKCRDVLAERHEEVGAALAEAAAAGKAHAAAAADWRAAALKLRHAYDTRARLQAADPPRHKKLRALDKELDKRRGRHAEARTRALRARADYVLALEAANATLQRYYLDDIADIILCMEVGFEAVVGRALRTAGEAESARAAAADGAGAALRAAADALDALADRQRLLDAHAPAFAPPRPLAWAGAAPAAQDADVRDLLGEAAGADEPGERAQRELAARLAQLEAGARALRLECREGAKTLDAAEAELLRQLDGGDAAWDVRAAFGPGGKGAAGLPAPPAPPPEDQEDYYLAKFRSYVSCAGRLARLESKAAGVRSRLLASGAGRPEAPPSPPTPPRRAAARLRRGQFAAPLEARLPVVLTSCVRVIAGYGLRHQGLFRVSGSQVEMQALRAAFERGEDPLAGVRDASDINSVCGLLKLFLRELRPPLLPPALQERLLRLAALPDDGAWAARARDTLGALPAPALLVLRYLFAFLAHLAEHAEHNMMDAWNLAICLGPTLLAAWGDGGAQVAQQNLLNELVKRIILHHERVFPQDVAPHALYTRRPPEDVAPDDTDSTAPPENGLAASHESPAPHEPPPPHAPGEPHESHEPHEPHESLGPLGDSHEEPDIGDDLSLYDDDDDEDDVTDEDGESGDWADRDSVDYHREAERRAPQVEPAADETAGAAAASSPQCRRLAETPDLVLDLPARAADPADTFAHNRDTLKKRPRRADAPPAPPAPPAPDGSPVPARNTARVAAKFAELTLTGGSLKPALAAKPALLRRPTPHPHARAAPPAPQAPPAPPEGDASADGAPRS